MDLIGKIKKIGETKEFGANGFRKRELVITTQEQYPQFVPIEFVQDKVSLLDVLQVGQEVKVSVNIRGREWISPEGEARYFVSLQGWKIELMQPVVANTNTPPPAPQDNFETMPDNNTNGNTEEAEDDLPF